jgi:hypothetical protein
MSSLDKKTRPIERKVPERVAAMTCLSCPNWEALPKSMGVCHLSPPAWDGVCYSAPITGAGYWCSHHPNLASRRPGERPK